MLRHIVIRYSMGPPNYVFPLKRTSSGHYWIAMHLVIGGGVQLKLTVVEFVT